MAEKLTNITDPKYRCSIGACPAVYKSEDGKTFTIVGEEFRNRYSPELAGKVGPTEAAVEVSADLLLSSLGVAELVEALKKAILKMDEVGFLDCGSSEARALREARKKFQGGSS